RRETGWCGEAGRWREKVMAGRELRDVRQGKSAHEDKGIGAEKSAGQAGPCGQLAGGGLVLRPGGTDLLEESEGQGRFLGTGGASVDAHPNRLDAVFRGRAFLLEESLSQGLGLDIGELAVQMEERLHGGNGEGARSEE